MRHLARIVWTFTAVLVGAGACLSTTGLSAGLSVAPAHASDASTTADTVLATELSPNQFLSAFDNAVLPGLGEIGPAPQITGDAKLDARIRAIATIRGYKRRPAPDRPLVRVDGYLLQPEAAQAWASLKAATNRAGFNIRINSAYRSYATQAALVRERFADTSYAAINKTLTTRSIPGYSKHHTGYAIDVSSGGTDFENFGGTATYRWLAADNFANAKIHGWIPSYPSGSRPAGPIPEPWEFVWVGATNILCGDFEPTPQNSFCDTSGSAFAADIEWLVTHQIATGCRRNRFCGNERLSRGQAATLLWRYAGEPAPRVNFEFLDVNPDEFFFDAAEWLFAEGLTTGISQTTFGPHRLVSREEFVTYLWRFAGRPEPNTTVSPFADVLPSNFAMKAIFWAAENDITHSISNRAARSTTTGDYLPLFGPKDTTTRDQAASFIRRFASYQEQSGDAVSSPWPTRHVTRGVR